MQQNKDFSLKNYYYTEGYLSVFYFDPLELSLFTTKGLNLNRHRGNSSLSPSTLVISALKHQNLKLINADS
jgi:hypothetical protein